MRRAIRAALLAALLGTSCTAAQGNLVQNGDFSSGLADWGGSGWADEQPDYPGAFADSFSSYPATLSQTVDGTQKLVCYQVSFYAFSDKGDTLDECGIEVQFGDLSSGFFPPSTSGATYTYYARASQVNDVITFTAYNNPDYDYNYITLDNVVVQAAPLVDQVNCNPVSSITLRRRRDTQRVLGCDGQQGHRECPIRPGSRNTVCVDTQREIEYCGSGCVNCLDMEGAGDVACEEGQCVALTCGDGYAMQADQCVPTASSNA